MELNANGASPLYYLLQERIRKDINDGVYKPGSQIPAEPELRNMYQVSRITVRRAVEELCKEGLLEKKHGKGTFVKTQKIHRKLEHFMSFSESCRACGMEASSLLISKEIVSSQTMGGILSEKETGAQKYIYTRRVRLADGEPVMLENNYFPSPSYDFLLDEDLEGSLYELLREKYEIIVTSSTETYLDIARAGNDLAAFLKICKGEPLFLLHTKILDQSGNLIHIGHQYINSNHYRFCLSDSVFGQ